MTDKDKTEHEDDTNDPYTYDEEYDEYDEDSPSWVIANCTQMFFVPKCCNLSEAIDTREQFLFC